MAKKFKVLVSDTVPVPIVLIVKDSNGKEVEKRATLVCKRTTATAIRGEMADKDRTMAESLRNVITGWQDQNLVADEDTGQPADFCPEALDALLDVPGVATVAFTRYMTEAAAKEKN